MRLNYLINSETVPCQKLIKNLYTRLDGGRSKQIYVKKKVE